MSVCLSVSVQDEDSSQIIDVEEYILDQVTDLDMDGWMIKI